MRSYASPYGTITLTDERWRHITEFHPEVKGIRRQFAPTLARPEMTARSVHDSSVVICYRLLRQRNLYLAIVIHTKKRFVVTAYIAKNPKRDTV